MDVNGTKVKEAEEKKRSKFLDLVISNRALSLLLLIIVVSILMSAIFPESFFSYTNLSSILLALSIEGSLAVGMMFLIVGGVFDISIGSNLAVGGAVAAFLIRRAGISIPISMIAGIVACMAAGAANGIIVTRVGVNPLITTLAMLGILRGIAVLIAGPGIAALPPEFTILGQKMVLGLQLPSYYLFAITIICAFLLAKTRYFRQLYFIGGNRKAAALSGIKVAKILTVNFILMGLIAGITGVILAARLGSAIGLVGAGVELRVLTGVIIGGGSLSGGKGTVAGAFMGALFMGFIYNVMVIAGVNVYYQNIVIGIILLSAVSMDVILQRKFQV
jgi:ribose/xylose/arabinose/galactoside ABC-type transport system permease subunit